MIVVSDSTPLIHIAKVGLILEQNDAVVINEYIGKKIHVQNASSSSSYLVEKYSIHKGEADSIQLALEINALILMNERDGRNAAKSEGIKVKGSIGVLFDALREEVIDREEALSMLSRFRDSPQDFWIEPDIIKLAMEKISLEK